MLILGRSAMLDRLFDLLRQGLLTLLSLFTAYYAGKKDGEYEREKERADGLSAAHKARETLRDPDVVERLHDRFKR